VTVIDVVVPTFNGWDHLQTCLKALKQQTFAAMRVIVVDDGSTDGTGELVSNEFPDVDYLRLPGNLGFAAACNAGIAAGDSEFVALLNNDAIPEPDWLKALVAGMNRYPRCAALASKILLADQSGRLHSAGDTFSWSGLPNSRGVWEPDHGQYDVEEPVFSACAAAALYRRDALNEVSRVTGDVFDTDFFMYCEDIDLSWRLRLFGWNIMFIPGARVEHHLSATAGGPLASYYVARNRFGVIAKNVPDGLQRNLWLRFLANQSILLLRALRHVREPAARAEIRGVLAGPLFGIRQRPKRSLIQRSRRTDMRSVQQLFT
jgi:GT2 family glycosyltransferase